MLKRLKIVMALSLVFSSLTFNATLNAEDTYTKVSTTEEFLDAIKREEPKIYLTDTITVNEKVNINYDLDLKGYAEPYGSSVKIIFEGDTEGWQGNFILHFYKSKSQVKDISFRGGDAAILVNGSNVKIDGRVEFDSHEFGGIEVSRGKDVIEKGVLNFGDQIDISYYSENYENPLVWFDSEDSEMTNANFITMSRDVEKESKTQKYFYLNYQENAEEAKYSQSLIKDVNDTVRRYPHMGRMLTDDFLVIMRYEDIKDLEYRSDVADFIFFIITNMSEGVEFSFTHDGPRYSNKTDRKVLYQATQEAVLNYYYQGGLSGQDIALYTDFYVFNEEGLRGYVDITFLGHIEDDPQWEFYSKVETEFSRDLDQQVDIFLSDNKYFDFDKLNGVVTVNDISEATSDDKIDFISNLIITLDGVKAVSIGNMNKFTLTDDINDLIEYLETYFNVKSKLRVMSAKDLVPITLYDEKGEGVEYTIEFAKVDEIIDEDTDLIPDEKPDEKPIEKPIEKPEEKPEKKDEVETTPDTGESLSTSYYIMLLSVSVALFILVRKKRLFN